MVGFDVKTAPSEFPHDGHCGWICLEMEMAEISLHDNVVDGFDMKNEKVEFALDMNKI